jgi:hypothetical protein
MDIQDPRPHSLIRAILVGIVSGITRTILDWIMTLITH